MKTVLFITTIMFWCFQIRINADENQINEEVNFDIKTPINKERTLNINERNYFKNKTDGTIKISLKGTPKGFNKTLFINGAYIGNQTGTTITFDVTREIHGKLNEPGVLSAPLEIKDIANNKIYGLITFKWDSFTQGPKTDNKDDAEKKSLENKQQIITSFKSHKSYNNPYSIEENSVNLYFDEYGKLLNHLPTNTDQNDIFFFNIITPKGDENKYRVKIVDGEYSPVDLAIRPIIIPDVITGNATGEEKSYKATEYESITLQVGPFTSENFSFQITYDSINGKTYNGSTYSIKINKLYHVGIGVSIIQTQLENPDFRIKPLDKESNTIESFNTGPRSLLTFNVIWYWSILQQQRKGSPTTGGRDILKDEPTWSFNRIFPTIGVSLDKKISENFFAGLVYEFARGGSIIVGLHYGKVKELSDKDFILNKTPFTGTIDDIRINNVYKPAFFIGVNVDIRILNALFTK